MKNLEAGSCESGENLIGLWKSYGRKGELSLIVQLGKIIGATWEVKILEDGGWGT